VARETDRTGSNWQVSVGRSIQMQKNQEGSKGALLMHRACCRENNGSRPTRHRFVEKKTSVLAAMGILSKIVDSANGTKL